MEIHKMQHKYPIFHDCRNIFSGLEIPLKKFNLFPNLESGYRHNFKILFIFLAPFTPLFLLTPFFFLQVFSSVMQYLVYVRSFNTLI